MAHKKHGHKFQGRGECITLSPSALKWLGHKMEPWNRMSKTEQDGIARAALSGGEEYEHGRPVGWKAPLPGNWENLERLNR